MKWLKTYKSYNESQSVLLDLTDNIDHHLISKIKENVDVNSHILEISCGNGADAVELTKMGYDVTCTELNQSYVDNAIKLGLKCVHHDTKDKFPFKDDEFDLIYSRFGLHYFSEEELDIIFHELKRIGKKILITVKLVDDIKTHKVILNSEKWNEIISKFFIIKSFDIREGVVYGSKSKWIEIFAEKMMNRYKVFMESSIENLKEEFIQSTLDDFNIISQTYNLKYYPTKTRLGTYGHRKWTEEAIKNHQGNGFFTIITTETFSGNRVNTVLIEIFYKNVDVQELMDDLETFKSIVENKVTIYNKLSKVKIIDDIDKDSSYSSIIIHINVNI